MAYVGTLANLLPFPGGIGGVEGGMIGAFLAFGAQAHLTLLAVLAYRTISYWLPTVPGAIAYWRLRRQFRHAPDAAVSTSMPSPAGPETAHSELAQATTPFTAESTATTATASPARTPQRAARPSPAYPSPDLAPSSRRSRFGRPTRKPLRSRPDADPRPPRSAAVPTAAQAAEPAATATAAQPARDSSEHLAEDQSPWARRRRWAAWVGGSVTFLLALLGAHLPVRRRGGRHERSS
jgi:hypothetical protein